MRRELNRKLRLVEAFVLQGLAKAVEGVVQIALAERLAQCEPQRGDGEGFAGRFAKAIDVNLIDKKILEHNVVQPRAALHGSENGANIRIAAGVKQLAQGVPLRVERVVLAGLEGQTCRIFFKDGARFGDHSHGHDPRRFRLRRGGAVLRKGRTQAEGREADGGPSQNSQQIPHNDSRLNRLAQAPRRIAHSSRRSFGAIMGWDRWG